jgi:cyclohexanone monooxygenase
MESTTLMNQPSANPRANHSDEARTDVVDVIVVGAGFAGLYMVHRLRQAGMKVLGIEAGADVGGTWYWNRYPGARCDIPSLLYSYTWSPELRCEWQWTEKYATQPEILAYINHVADRFELRSAYQFETRVMSARFDADQSHWLIATDRGAELAARFCIMATGSLSAPREPDIKGVTSFAGAKYLTGRWPHEGVDFKNKRVALIGTGSSGIQSLPLIAKDAAHVDVFQRTASYTIPALNRQVTAEEVDLFNAMYPAFVDALQSGSPGIPVPPPEWQPTEQELAAVIHGLWSGDGLMAAAMIPNLTRDERVNEITADFVRGKIRETVADPKTAERLIPRDFPIATKRLCVDTDYYATFNRDNVTLVSLRETPIEEITPRGVRTTEREYPEDIIVFATGFDAMTGALLRVEIRGRDGVSLRDAWAHGPRTYLGLMVAGFPNLFTINGPGSPSVLSNMVTSAELHVDWIMNALEHLRRTGERTIEASVEAQDRWVENVNLEAEKTLFPRAASWYVGANVPGKPRVFMPYVGENYKIQCDAIAANGYEGFVFG